MRGEGVPTRFAEAFAMAGVVVTRWRKESCGPRASQGAHDLHAGVCGTGVSSGSGDADR